MGDKQILGLEKTHKSWGGNIFEKRGVKDHWVDLMAQMIFKAALFSNLVFFLMCEGIKKGFTIEHKRQITVHH